MYFFHKFYKYYFTSTQYIMKIFLKKLNPAKMPPRHTFLKQEHGENIHIKYIYIFNYICNYIKIYPIIYKYAYFILYLLYNI